MKLFKSFFLFISILTIFSACKKDEDSFTIVGTWQMDEVIAEVNVMGVSETSTDASPSGTIQFKEDGSGEANYSFNVLGDDYSREGSFTWTLDGRNLTIQAGSDATVWALTTMENNLLVGEFTEEIVANVTTTFNFKLSR